MKNRIIINQLLIIVIKIISITHIKFIVWIGETIGLLLWFFSIYHRSKAKKNFDLLLGKFFSNQSRSLYLKKYFISLSCNTLIAIKIPFLTDEEIKKYFYISNENLSRFHKDNSKSSILVAWHHFGCSNIISLFSQVFLNASKQNIYQLINSKLHVLLQNPSNDANLFFKKNWKLDIKKTIFSLKNSNFVSIFTDEFSEKSSIWLPCFGRLMPQSPLIGMLAKKSDAKLFFCGIKKIASTRWEIDTVSPLSSKEKKICEITDKISDCITLRTKLLPNQYHWLSKKFLLPQKFLLCRPKNRIYISLEKKLDTLQPFHLLIRSPNWLGDACMSIPAIYSIKKSRPDIQLTIVTPKKLVQFWKYFPEISRIIEIPEKASPWYVNYIIRISGQYDALLLLTNSVRSALEILFTNIARRIGTINHRTPLLLNQILDYPVSSNEHQTNKLLLLIEKVLGGNQPIKFIPRQLPQHLLTIGVVPGAEYGATKRWPIERYRAVIEEISRDYDVKWIILGTKKEQKLCQELSNGLENVLDYSGKTDISDLISLIKSTHLLVTNDTGTMHLASLFSVSVVAIFGSTNPLLTGPIHWSNQDISHHTIIQNQLECSPCFLRTCPIDFPCMMGITVKQVVSAIQKILNLLSFSYKIQKNQN